jgi:hypothetical protein
MSHARHHALRRLALVLAAVACVIGSEVALPDSRVSPGIAKAVADSGSPQAYDRSLHAADCGLLGREFVPGLGCARDRCVDGATPWRRAAGAEACALVGKPPGFGFAATVPASRCVALHRRWIDQVNYCASQPDRSVPFVRDAPQCTGAASVYVILAETPGRYDECLTPARADELSRLAAARGTELADEVAVRSSTQCVDRPGHAYVDGRCTHDAGHRHTGGGVLIVGDSMTWRGGDELARLRPGFAIDGEPARRPTELAARLDAYRAGHGQPSGLVVELGTNAAPDYGRADLAAVVRTLPAAAAVLFVLPYVEAGGPAPSRFAAWMRSVAAARPGTCVADWPAYVRAHPGLLQDGIHVRNDAEGEWARWVSEQWARC